MSVAEVILVLVDKLIKEIRNNEKNANTNEQEKK